MKKSTNIKSKSQPSVTNESSGKCIWGDIDMSKEHYYCVVLPGKDIPKEIYDILMQNKIFVIHVKDRKINVYIPMDGEPLLYTGVICEVKQEYIDEISIGTTSYKNYVDKHFANKLDKNKTYCLIPYIDEPICEFTMNDNIKTLNDVYELLKSGIDDSVIMSECTSYTSNNKERVILTPFICFSYLACMTRFNKNEKPFIDIDILRGIDIDNCEVKLGYPYDNYYTITFNMKNNI